MLTIYFLVLVTDDNGLLISQAEQQATGLLDDTYNVGAEFQLCSGENLCSGSSNDCFKFEICAVDSVRSPSKIRYDTVHKWVAYKWF